MAFIFPFLFLTFLTVLSALARKRSGWTSKSNVCAIIKLIKWSCTIITLLLLLHYYLFAWFLFCLRLRRNYGKEPEQKARTPFPGSFAFYPRPQFRKRTCSNPTSLFTFGSISGDQRRTKTDYACSDTVSNKLWRKQQKIVENFVSYKFFITSF